MIQMLGYVAGLCILICNIPQLVKILVSKKAQDVSIWMYLLASLGGILWFIYGILMKDWTLIVSNIIISCIDMTILFLIIRWR
jgi:MtN3 and saliva related transmembrane protein